MKTLITLLMLTAGVSNAQNKELYRICNNAGYVIATLTVINNDVQELRDYKGMYLGRYITRMNTTYDSIGRVFGSGNLISLLIKKDEE